ncbi:MAG: hypothetical protein ABIF22_03140 [bacterium]
MTNEIKTEELTREQILDLADAQGKKLGFLLATSPLEEETKKAILDILKNATPEQLDAIADFFEEGYLMAQNEDLNGWFKIQLENIKAEFDQKQQELDENTIKNIEKLEEFLK